MNDEIEGNGLVVQVSLLREPVIEAWSMTGFALLIRTRGER